MERHPSPNPDRWSRERWAAAVVLLFAAQVAVLWKLAAPLPASTGSTPSVMAMRLVLGPRANQQLLDSLAAGDPALFARVSPRAFSGAAWLNPPRQEYRLQDWTDPERFMDRSTSHIGAAFREFLRTNQSAPVAVADKQAVAPTVEVAAGGPVVRESSWRVEGPLRARPVVQTVQPRSFAHTDLLADTSVEVFVTSEGLVFSPRLALDSAPGDPAQRAANQHALDLTRLLRFQPLPKSAPAGTMTRGTLVFRWHVVPPTNAPAPPP
jgi:hypothetical protein